LVLETLNTVNIALIQRINKKALVLTTDYIASVNIINGVLVSELVEESKDMIKEENAVLRKDINPYKESKNSELVSAGLDLKVQDVLLNKEDEVQEELLLDSPKSENNKEESEFCGVGIGRSLGDSQGSEIDLINTENSSHPIINNKKQQITQEKEVEEVKLAVKKSEKISDVRLKDHTFKTQSIEATESYTIKEQQFKLIESTPFKYSKPLHFRIVKQNTLAKKVNNITLYYMPKFSIERYIMRLTTFSNELLEFICAEIVKLLKDKVHKKDLLRYIKLFNTNTIKDNEVHDVSNNKERINRSNKEDRKEIYKENIELNNKETNTSTKPIKKYNDVNIALDSKQVQTYRSLIFMRLKNKLSKNHLKSTNRIILGQIPNFIKQNYISVEYAVRLIEYIYNELKKLKKKFCNKRLLLKCLNSLKVGSKNEVDKLKLKRLKVHLAEQEEHILKIEEEKEFIKEEEKEFIKKPERPSKIIGKELLYKGNLNEEEVKMNVVKKDKKVARRRNYFDIINEQDAFGGKEPIIECTHLEDNNVYIIKDSPNDDLFYSCPNLNESGELEDYDKPHITIEGIPKIAPLLKNEIKQGLPFKYYHMNAMEYIRSTLQLDKLLEDPMIAILPRREEDAGSFLNEIEPKDLLENNKEVIESANIFEEEKVRKPESAIQKSNIRSKGGMLALNEMEENDFVFPMKAMNELDVQISISSLDNEDELQGYFSVSKDLKRNLLDKRLLDPIVDEEEKNINVLESDLHTIMKQSNESLVDNTSNLQAKNVVPYEGIRHPRIMEVEVDGDESISSNSEEADEEIQNLLNNSNNILPLLKEMTN